MRRFKFFNSNRHELLSESDLAACNLQGGRYQTKLIMIVSKGRPVLANHDCKVEWYRSSCGDTGSNNFTLIQGASETWYQPSCDDIGCRILAKLIPPDLPSRSISLGPIVEDPNVRSQVESLLEQKCVVFSDLQVKSNTSPETDTTPWTLIADATRIRVMNDTALIPPYESMYSSALLIQPCVENPTAFQIHLPHETLTLEITAENNAVRDTIVLVLGAFRAPALQSFQVQDAIHRGHSPMLTAHTRKTFDAATGNYNLPWDALSSSSNPDVILSDADALIHSYVD